MSLDQKVLVLNQSWVPIKVITIKKAISLLFKEVDGKSKAKVVSVGNFQAYTWADWSKIKPSADDKTIQTPVQSFKLPQVILLTDYNSIPRTKVIFNRKNLFKRDNCCQYCGKTTNELTIDHVIPKSKGGKTNWTNCVLACIKCNSKKANKSLKDTGMKLLKTPIEPPCNFVLDAEIAKTWQELMEMSYWNVPLS